MKPPRSFGPIDLKSALNTQYTDKAAVVKQPIATTTAHSRPKETMPVTTKVAAPVNNRVGQERHTMRVQTKHANYTDS